MIYNKGDYIHTLPLQTALVKARKVDSAGKTYYKVRDSGNCKFNMPNKLITRMATPSEKNEFCIRLAKSHDSAACR